MSRCSRFLPALGSGTFMKYSDAPPSRVTDLELAGVSLVDLIRQRLRPEFGLAQRVMAVNDDSQQRS